MKSRFAASGDQPLFGTSGDDASAASGKARGTGSNSENNNRPAKNPPICACQATLTPSTPIAIDPIPKMILTPNLPCEIESMAVVEQPLLLLILSVYVAVPLAYSALTGLLAGIVGRWMASRPDRPTPILLNQH